MGHFILTFLGALPTHNSNSLSYIIILSVSRLATTFLKLSTSGVTLKNAKAWAQSTRAVDGARTSAARAAFVRSYDQEPEPDKARGNGGDRRGPWSGFSNFWDSAGSIDGFGAGVPEYTAEEYLGVKFVAGS